MSTTIPAVNGNAITHAVLVRIDTGEEVYRISNIYTPITHQGETYLPLGNFIGVSDIIDDITASNADVSINLSGINEDAITLVLATPIKGSEVQIFRAFIDEDTGLPLSGQVYLRFKGYINNFSIGETYGMSDSSHTVSMSATSIHSLLEKKQTGRRTRPTDQKRFYPGDTSMDRIVSLNKTTFNFGWTPPTII